MNHSEMLAKIPPVSETSSETNTMIARPIKWLSLKEASDFLGVHYTTLRSWSDNGEIAVFRTPGGHRRFSLADLRRFLDERAGNTNPPKPVAWIDEAIGRTRQAIAQEFSLGTGWRYPLAASDDEVRRTRGRKLFSLAIAYVIKTTQRERTILDAVELGREYGFEAGNSGITLADAGRAVQFFRGQLVRTLLNQDGRTAQDADDQQIRLLVDQFLDEVLYAVLDGFESAQRHLHASV